MAGGGAARLPDAFARPRRLLAATVEIEGKNLLTLSSHGGSIAARDHCKIVTPGKRDERFHESHVGPAGRRIPLPRRGHNMTAEPREAAPSAPALEPENPTVLSQRTTDFTSKPLTGSLAEPGQPGAAP